MTCVNLSGIWVEGGLSGAVHDLLLSRSRQLGVGLLRWPNLGMASIEIEGGPMTQGNLLSFGGLCHAEAEWFASLLGGCGA